MIDVPLDWEIFHSDSETSLFFGLNSSDKFAPPSPPSHPRRRCL